MRGRERAPRSKAEADFEERRRVVVLVIADRCVASPPAVSRQRRRDRTPVYA